MDNSIPITEDQSKINLNKNNGISSISVNVSENNISEIDLKQNLYNKNISILNSILLDPNCKSFFNSIYQTNIDEIKTFFRNELLRPWEYIDEEGYSCLHRACFLNLDIVVNLILEEMKLRSVAIDEIKNLVNKTSINGSRAIHFASYRGNIDTIKLLIQNGAEINVTNERGLNVIHMAAQGDQPGSLIYFKEKYNLDITAKDNLGNTPLHWCCYTGSENFLSFILSYNDDSLFKINSQDNQGLSPLHLSVISEKTKIVKKLLFQGADRKLKDKRNRTAYLLAVEKRKNTIAELLKEDQDCMCNFNCLMRSNFEKTERTLTNMLLFIILHVIIENITFFLLLPHFRLYSLSITFLSFFLLVMILFIILNCSNPGYEGYNLMEYRQADANFHPRKILLDLVEKNISIDDYCPYCIIIKNDKNCSKHCYYCNRCIKDYDHHCYWVNNCIGGNNINLFFIFITVVLLNLMMQILVALSCLFMNDANISTDLDPKLKFNFPPYFELFKKLDLYDNNIKSIICSILLIISICFFIPVSYLWIKNVKSLCLRMKKKKKEKFEMIKKLQETIVDEEGVFLLKNNKE